MFDASRHHQNDAVFNPFMIRAKTAAGPSLAARLWANVARFLTAIGRKRKVWITIDRLRRLDDRTLRDIGVERDQIETVVRDRSVHW